MKGKNEIGMSLIVKTTTRWIKGFIFLFGCYIFTYGHLSPGGGFPGGVIIAAVFILLTLAFGKEYAERKLWPGLASELDSLGALIFLFIGITAIYFGGYLFENFIEKYYPTGNFRVFSAGVIPLQNFAIAVKVGTSLFMVFIILAVRRVVLINGKGKLISTPRRDEK